MTTCGDTIEVKRGARQNGKDHTPIVTITHVCTRKPGHRKPHKNGLWTWGKGSAPHSMRKAS